MTTTKGTFIAVAVLAVTTIIFIGIGSRFLVNPAAGAAGQGLALRTPFAATTVRVGLGVFPLGFAIVTVAGLVSPARRRDALAFVTAVFALALAARVASIVADHAMTALNVRLVIIEAVVLAVSAAVLALDRPPARTRDA